MSESLAATISSLAISRVDAQLASLAGNQRLGTLAAFGLRGELVYPVPCVLEAKPALLGYYRLLYGFSQKEFYKPSYYGRFKAMESRNILSVANRDVLDVLCKSLIETAGLLVEGIQPITQTALHELQLLTLGPQLRGSQNNTIGQGAIKQVFELIKRLVR